MNFSAYRFIRPFLFRLDPETAHDLTVKLLAWAGRLDGTRKLLGRIYTPENCEKVHLAGLDFPNRVGLAAGYDKHGICYQGLASLGFGHVELGTVTPLPQSGNIRPRIFRLPNHQAVINRMGFPGPGMVEVSSNLPDRKIRLEKFQTVLGMNIGKNKDTPNQEAVNDYLKLIDQFHTAVDYFSVNVSSPNTVGLRSLQARTALEEIITGIVRERDSILESSERQLPIFVKLSPDLDSSALDDALEAVIQGGADGVIAVNTTTRRIQVDDHPLASEQGGLSGKPILDLSTSMVRKIYRLTDGDLPIIGVGGILSAEDAGRMLDAGASLVQIYTGLIYQGPALVKQIVDNLS